MLKPVMLALSLMLVAPLAAQAAEITLFPAVTLHIGDRDKHGNYWDGGHWRDHGWWKKHYQWRDNRWQPHGRFADRHDDRRDRHDGPREEWRHR